MDVSEILEAEKLFTYVQVKELFDAQRIEPLKALPTAKAELVLNLCRLSAAEFALLRRSLLLQPIVNLPLEVSNADALFAVAKTDTTVFNPCRASLVLPNQDAQSLSVNDFVLFTGDGDKISEHWNSYKKQLADDGPYAAMLKDLSAKYTGGTISKSRFPFNMLDASTNRILPWQLLLIRAKLDICLGAEESTIRGHLKHSASLL